MFDIYSQSREDSHRTAVHQSYVESRRRYRGLLRTAVSTDKYKYGYFLTNESMIVEMMG